jgi:hypothetical protein
MAVSRTNINKPEIDFPVLIGELGDIPRMLRDAGAGLNWYANLSFTEEKWRNRALREIPTRSADAYLWYQFGIEPLVRDVLRMLDFQALIAKKLRMLRRLYENGAEGSGFTSTVWSEDVQGAPVTMYLSGLYQETNRFSFRATTSWRKWVSVKWKPTTEPPEPGSIDEQRLVVRLTYGLDLSFSTWWELIPWSFLIDWFTGFGSYLNRFRNTVPVHAGNSCVMVSERTRWEIPVRVGGSGGIPILLTQPRITHERKIGASLGGNSIFRELPFLNGHQLSILGALITSSRGRHTA